MKISIITACYNNENTIEETIKSIASQNFKNVEFIIIDGKSTDNTLQIVKNNKKYISLCISEKDNGIYDALNKGIKLASGEIIGLLHADDCFANKNVLYKVNRAFEENNCDVLYGNLEYVKRDKPDKTFRFWRAGAFKNRKLYFGWMPPHPTLFCRKEIFERYGMYNIEFKIAADYDFMLRLLKERNLKVCYLDNTLVKMKTGGESNKSIKNIIKKSIEDYKVIKANKIGGILTILLKNIRKTGQLFLKG